MKITEEIQKISIVNNIDIEIMNIDFSKHLVDNILYKYVGDYNAFLWEGLINSSILNDKNGWSYISDFVGNSKCLMFFNYLDDKNIIMINSGDDLYKILYESYGFEFYITDIDTRYLICFNHHDCLIGCGRAKLWVDSLK